MCKIVYNTIPMQEMTEIQLKACSELFSENYGTYDNNNGDLCKRGKKIKLGVGYYKRNYCKPYFYVACAQDGEKIIAHAIYLRKFFGEGRAMTWVVQLVVHRDYRSQGIGKRLLNSAWGFSNDFAWGLATSNPYTVKTLEASTFRKVRPEYVVKHLSEIKELAELANFVGEFKVNEEKSIIDTKFYTDHTDVENNIAKVFKNSNWILGKLEPGEEWLAFTFGEQEFEPEYDGDFLKLLTFSEEQLREAYGRMQKNQNWQKKADYEVEYIISKCRLVPGAKVLDFGCGDGRHSLALDKKGMDVTGIDFSRKVEDNVINGCSAKFVHGDCRTYQNIDKVDLAVALYDVVGSFPQDEDNDKIIRNSFNNLKRGGYFVLSVMNMELTEYLVDPKYRGDIRDNLKTLQLMPASDIMQVTGNVYDPKYFFLDPETRIVYRKEQFKNDNNLSAEYIIRDRRYTVLELRNKLQQSGFEVLEIRPVQLGKWDVNLSATDSHAKEILAICRKP